MSEQQEKRPWTPGPWEFHGGSLWQIVGAANGSVMDDQTYYPSVPELEADWHLIAAAPDLYEALQYVLDVRGVECKHAHPGPDESCAKCKADAALSKALGKEVQ